MIYQREIQLQTSQHSQMHDLTDEIAQVVGESRVRSVSVTRSTTIQ